MGLPNVKVGRVMTARFSCLEKADSACLESLNTLKSRWSPFGDHGSSTCAVPFSAVVASGGRTAGFDALFAAQEALPPWPLGIP
jgi:hypothetical protein